MGVWYLLYDGNSVDDRGMPDYVGRTTHKEIARKHHEKVRSSPHSTGMVMVATDFDYFQADDAWFESGS